MYNLSRDTVESMGRSGAGVIEETPNTQVVRVLNKFDLFVLKDDVSLTPCLRDDGFWESWITSWLTRWLRPGMTFLDIGANCGYYSAFADSLVGPFGTVVAFEPNPVYAELLRTTRNRNDSDYKIREVGLSDHSGHGILSVPDKYHGSASTENTFSEFKHTRTYGIHLSTLDAEAQQFTFVRHDIIKIDAEGAEEKILKGGTGILNSLDHTTLLIEYTPHVYSEKFTDFLYDWGTVSAVTYDGGEMRVSKDWIESLTDFEMLVIRKR